MINYSNIKVNNLYTEGFEVSIPNPLQVAISSGKFIQIVNGEKEVKEYPAIEFDVEPDKEVFKVYDVYLLDDENDEGIAIQIDSTEIALGVVPIYEGKVPLVHCLTSIKVPPELDNLNDLDIEVRTLQMIGGDSNESKD